MAKQEDVKFIKLYRQEAWRKEPKLLTIGSASFLDQQFISSKVYPIAI